MGLQGRYFGRWLLPIFPILCLLAAFFARGAARGRWRAGAPGAADGRALRLGARAAPVLLAAAVALLAQGLVYSVHSGARARARRHAQPDARVDGRPRPRRRADRGRAGLARRVGATKLRGSPAGPAAGASTPRWSRGSTPAARCSPAHARGRDRGLRAHARPGADRLLRRTRLLLGRERLDAVGARVRGPARRCRGRSPTTARSRARRSRLPRLALRRAARARSRSASTGASTTTRSPTTGRAR